MTKYAVLLPAITIDASNRSIRFRENATTANATITSGTYFLRGDGTSDDLLKGIKDALEAATASTNTYTVSLTLSADASADTGQVTITRATGTDTFQLLWSNAATTFDEALIGFADSDSALDANAKSGTLSPTGLWVAPEIYREFEREDDYAIGGSRAISGKPRNVKRGGPYEARRWVCEMFDSRRVWAHDSSSDTPRAFSTFLDEWCATRFEFHQATSASYPALDALSTSTRAGTYVFEPDSVKTFQPQRQEPGIALYDFSMRMRAYVA